jgi:hypothetical protein
VVIDWTIRFHKADEDSTTEMALVMACLREQMEPTIRLELMTCRLRIIARSHRYNG